MTTVKANSRKMTTEMRSKVIGLLISSSLHVNSNRGNKPAAQPYEFPTRVGANSAQTSTAILVYDKLGYLSSFVQKSVDLVLERWSSGVTE